MEQRLTRFAGWVGEDVASDRVALIDRNAGAAFSLAQAILDDEQAAIDVVCASWSVVPAATPAEHRITILADVHRRAVTLRRSRRNNRQAGAGSTTRFDAFETLTSKQRLVLGLVYYDGFTVGEVAQRLGVTRRCVHRELTAALEQVQATATATAVMTMEREVTASSLERHRHALALALSEAPRALRIDFTETRVLDQAGARLLAEAAICCDADGVELRVVESRPVREALGELGLTGSAEWLAHAHLKATTRPTQLSQRAFRCTAQKMSPAELETARLSCWSIYHAATTSATRRAAQLRLGTVLRAQRAQQRARSTPTASPAHPPIPPRTGRLRWISGSPDAAATDG